MQRCLTEMLQGDTLKTIQWLTLNRNETFDSVYEHKISNMRNAGHLPPHMLMSQNKPLSDDAFKKTFISHKDSLRFLTDKVLDNGYELYVRDNSFLAFPAFNIYIPHMSETKKIDSLDLEIFMNLNTIKRCLLRINHATRGELQYLANVMEKIKKSSYYRPVHPVIVEILSNVLVADAADFRQLFELDFLLGLLYLRLGEYKKAYRHLHDNIEKNSYRLSNNPYYHCSLYYLQYKARRKSNEKIASYLSDVFGKKMTQEIMSDLRAPKNTFQYFDLPSCGQCSRCAITTHCYVKKL